MTPTENQSTRSEPLPPPTGRARRLLQHGLLLTGLVAASLLLSALSLGSFAQARPAVATETGGGPIVFEGTYRWTDGGGGAEPITVTLAPRGEGSWAGIFEFRFSGRDRSWKGTLNGDPIDGELAGEVTSGRGRRPRTWVLEGKARNGVLEATHRERLRSGRLQKTGTLEVRLVDDR